MLELDNEISDFLESIEDESYTAIESALDYTNEDLDESLNDIEVLEQSAIFDFSIIPEDDEEKQIIQEAFGPFGKRQPLEKCLASRERLIRKRCKTLADVEALADVFKEESSTFTNHLKAMKRITEKLQKGQIDAGDAKRQIGPYVKTLKSQADIIQFGQIVQDKMNISDTDIKFLADYNRGIGNIISRLRKELAAKKVTEGLTVGELDDLTNTLDSSYLDPETILYGTLDADGIPASTKEAYEFLMDVSDEDREAARRRAIERSSETSLEHALEGLESYDPNYNPDDVIDGLYNIEEFAIDASMESAFENDIDEAFQFDEPSDFDLDLDDIYEDESDQSTFEAFEDEMNEFNRELAEEGLLDDSDDIEDLESFFKIDLDD